MDLHVGQHTKSIIISTPSAASGGIMRFAKATPKCMGCKTPLKPGTKTLCGNCKPREAELYLLCLGQSNELENQFGRLWTECQRCQGSIIQDVLCTNGDCPIFYRYAPIYCAAFAGFLHVCAKSVAASQSTGSGNSHVHWSSLGH